MYFVRSVFGFVVTSFLADILSETTITFVQELHDAHLLSPVQRLVLWYLLSKKQLPILESISFH